LKVRDWPIGMVFLMSQLCSSDLGHEAVSGVAQDTVEHTSSASMDDETSVLKIIPPENLKAITAQAYLAKISGHTSVGLKVRSDEPAWSVYYRPDGKQYGTYGDSKDVGSWRVATLEGVTHHCSLWTNWGDGSEACFPVKLFEQDIIVGMKDGDISWAARVVPKGLAEGVGDTHE